MIAIVEVAEALRDVLGAPTAAEVAVARDLLAAFDQQPKGIASPTWIPCEQNTPTLYEWVWAVDASDANPVPQRVHLWQLGGRRFWATERGPVVFHTFTHWMAIPRLPDRQPRTTHDPLPHARLQILQAAHHVEAPPADPDRHPAPAG